MKAWLANAWRHARAPQAPGINFQQTSAAYRPLVVVLWLATAVLVFSAWHHWERMAQQQQQTDELEQQFIQLARRQEQLVQAAIRLSPQQKQQLAAFAQQKASPFALMDVVAQAWSKDVALTRVEVNTQAQRLHLDLETKVLGDVFRFVERLQAQPGVGVTLQQSALKPNDPQQPVQVKLTVGAG
ncbi:hypothetical protein [Pseudomonas poae]|uniref:Uncharacterized protein n=1 Tax=Pseudomonas poae TaxID=200451 RepID=A0A2S9EL76_9PSED|nr:hypothetical protein [Pseudomonas poae]PRA32414.1 hypothetical protein CQZ97_06940 [Pseudomonas poae]PRC16157.1 hypothetical protein CQZ99_16930 [Pseudomonas poae]